MSSIGIVVIGRNEGNRLHDCLKSLFSDGAIPNEIVYVDSGSVDESVEFARSAGVHVIDLDSTIPFSAARARNAGANRLVELLPELDFVQFIDGDCRIISGWLKKAVAVLENQSNIAAVCGRRRELYPERSPYNQLCDFEWDTPIGETLSCGGDSLMRLTAFLSVRGFNATVSSGEEPELCQRLRHAGWKLLRIDADMTLHDAAILRFYQWWRRQLRSGYGSLDVASRFGVPSFQRQIWNARVWVIGWSALTVLAMIIGGFELGPSGAIWGFIIGLLIITGQSIRLAIRERHRLRGKKSILYGISTMIAKWPHFIGQCQYLCEKKYGRDHHLIEYK